VLTDEDKKVIEDQIKAAIGGEELGKSIGTQIRKIVPGMMSTSVAEALKPLTEKFDGFTAKMAEIDEIKKALDEPPVKGTPKKGDPDPDAEKRFKKLELDLAAEKTRREKAEAETKAAEDKRRAGHTRSEFLREAASNNIRDPHIAFSYLAPLLELGDDGTSVIGRLKQKDGTEEKFPLSEFLTQWSQSEEGKHFVLAPAAGGSGAQSGARTPGGTVLSDNDLILGALRQPSS